MWIQPMPWRLCWFLILLDWNWFSTVTTLSSCDQCSFSCSKDLMRSVYSFFFFSLLRLLRLVIYWRHFFTLFILQLHAISVLRFHEDLWFIYLLTLYLFHFCLENPEFLEVTSLSYLWQFRIQCSCMSNVTMYASSPAKSCSD